MSFWDTSTLEQKIEQIEGAIECDLSQEQTAINLGTSRSSIRSFCEKNGITFNKKNSFKIGRERKENLDKVKQDYFSGQRRNFWYA